MFSTRLKKYSLNSQPSLNPTNFPPSSKKNTTISCTFSLTQAKNFLLERQLRKQRKTPPKITPNRPQTSQIRSQHSWRTKKLIPQRQSHPWGIDQLRAQVHKLQFQQRPIFFVVISQTDRDGVFRRNDLLYDCYWDQIQSGGLECEQAEDWREVQEAEQGWEDDKVQGRNWLMKMIHMKAIEIAGKFLPEKN